MQEEKEGNEIEKNMAGTCVVILLGWLARGIIMNIDGMVESIPQSLFWEFLFS